MTDTPDTVDNKDAIDRLVEKLRGEVNVHNTLAERITATKEQVTQSENELLLKRGRIGLLQEQITELGGNLEEIFADEGSTE